MPQDDLSLRRLWVAALGISSGTCLFWAGLSLPRLLVHLGLLASLIVQGVLVARQARGDGTEPATGVSLVAVTALLLGDVAVTGDLGSPVLPTVLWLAARPSSLGWSRSTRIATALVLSAPVVFALGPPWLPVGYCGSAWRILFVATAFLATRYVARTLVVETESLAKSCRDLAVLRRDAVEDAVRRARDLESIGANVARELRVPLASLKAGLDRERASAPDPRSAQRLEMAVRQLIRIDGVVSSYLARGPVPTAEARSGARASEEVGAPSPPAIGRRADWRATLMFAHALAATGLLVLAGLPVARSIALVTLALGTIARALWTRVADRRGVADNVASTAFADFATMAIAVALTGGPSSPLMLGVVVPPLAVMALDAGKRAARSPRLSLSPRWFTVAEALALSLCAVAPAPLMAASYARPVFVAGAQVVNLVVMAVYLGHVAAALRMGVGAAQRGITRERTVAMTLAASRTGDLEAVAAKVGHELKNPLAAVKSLLQLEEDRDRTASSRVNLEAMLRDLTRVEAILNDYLTFSRPFDMSSWASVDLGVVCDEVMASLSSRVYASRVRLHRGGAAPCVMADARRLRQAVFQLVCNALDATPTGGEVALWLGSSDRISRLVVRDSGTGMTAAALEKIGTPFFTTRPTGTGLGVVIARMVIQQHGGALRFSSEPGRGTTAEMAIPSIPFEEGTKRVQSPAG